MPAMPVITMFAPLTIALYLLLTLVYVECNQVPKVLLVLLCTQHVIGTCFHNAFGYGFLAADGIYCYNASPQVQCFDEFRNGRYLIWFDADLLLPETDAIGLRPCTNHIQTVLHTVGRIWGIPADSLAIDGDHTWYPVTDVVCPITERLFKPWRVKYGEETVKRVMRRNATKIRKPVLKILEVVFAELLNVIPCVRAAEDGD